MKKKLLALVLATVLVAMAIVGGTFAYLSDVQSDVNVMTMGSVYIAQHEYQRVVNADGTYATKTIDNQTSYVLEDFVQGKPILPIVGDPNEPGNSPAYKGFDDTTVRMSQVGSYGGMDVFAGKNAVDKFVVVENTGKSSAYIRTIVAVEIGEGDATLIGSSFHSTWTKNSIGTVEIDGNKYFVTEYIYAGAQLSDGSWRHEGGVLPAGDTAYPSLSQVYLKSKATNKDVEAIDGNNNGTLDILVVTQAVQVAGFENAAQALDAAFGDITVNNNPWTDGTVDVKIPEVIETSEDLAEVLAAAGAAGAGDTTIYFAADIDMTNVDWTPISVDGYHGADIVTINGNGHKITGLSAPLFKGGFAGGSGIIIENLTIADSEIESANTQGSGAFVECVDSMAIITLNNCHLINSKVYAPDARTGGLIGWTSGYSNTNDGAVKTYINVTNCSVVNCEITGTSVGAINGHAGASDWTYTTIDNCLVMGNTLVSVDDGSWRVGAIVGTANSGEVKISNITHNNNVLKQDAATGTTAPHDENGFVGRFVPNATGVLEIDLDSIQIAATDADDFAALENGKDVALTKDVTFSASETTANSGYGATGVAVKGGTFDGNGNTLTVKNAWNTWDCAVNTTGGTIKNLVINSAMRGIFMGGATADVYIDNVIIDGTVYTFNSDGGNKNYGVYISNSTLNGWTSHSDVHKEVVYTNCEFGEGSGYAFCRPYGPTAFVGCDFEAGFEVDAIGKVTFENCTIGGVALTADNLATLVTSNTANATVK